MALVRYQFDNAQSQGRTLFPLPKPPCPKMQVAKVICVDKLPAALLAGFQIAGIHSPTYMLPFANLRVPCPCSAWSGHMVD